MIGLAIVLQVTGTLIIRKLIRDRQIEERTDCLN